MIFLVDTQTNSAGIKLRDPSGDVRGIDLPHSVHVSVDESGEPYVIETLDAARWGDEFDHEAAERLVEWVREQLSNAAA